MKNATKRKIKKYFSLFIKIALVLAIVILAIYFANQKFNFLPASITNIWEDSNSSSIDTSNYKYVSTMTDKIVFADYFDIKVPPESYIPSKNLLDEKYKVYAKDGRLMIEVSDALSYPLHYSIYSRDGEMVEQGNLTVSHTIQMKSGIYIVCIGKTTHKIFL